MTRYEEYKAGEHEKYRIRGTNIGKKAVKDFVRGLNIRFKSPYEKIIADNITDENRIAVAAFHFFKWLAAIPGYGGKENEAVKIIVAWKSKHFEGTKYISNMLDPEGRENLTLLWCGDILHDLIRKYFELGERTYGEKKE